MKSHPRNSRIRFLLLFLGAVLCIPRTLGAFRPLFSRLALVAGNGTQGFRDGAFSDAFFNQPGGLAFSEDSTRLFVADTLNHRIRVVQLDQDNAVTTLSGQDPPGLRDGPVSSALFNLPLDLAVIPGEKLVVNDTGNRLLRVIDLKNGVVSTLMGSPHPPRKGPGEPRRAGTPAAPAQPEPATQVSAEGIRDLAYLASADSIFFTQPSQGTLKRLDLKTGLVTLCLDHHSLVPRPGALCALGDELYLADQIATPVFRLQWRNGALSDPVSVANSAFQVIALAKSSDALYALQGATQGPLERLLPETQAVTFLSVWGDEVPNPGDNLEAVAYINDRVHPGFVMDPSEQRKVYIANPTRNIITAFRDLVGNDLTGGDWRNSNGLNEPEYPARKPAKTFRILFVGDSRSTMMVPYPYPPTFNSQHSQFPRVLSICKKMELELNTLASLDDAPLNFEVLNLSHSGTEPLFLWPTYEVPGIVARNDIDLVVLLFAPDDYSARNPASYFERPLTPDGIPAERVDPEYLLKPYQQRIGPKGEPRRFYEIGKEKHLVKVEGNNLVIDDGFMTEPKLHDLLVDMLGKPLGILNQKLGGMRTSSGGPVRLLLCFTPTGYSRPCTNDEQLRKDITAKFGVPFLDLTAEMTALRVTYNPLSETGSAWHFDPAGMEFFARLFAHHLIRDGWVPWASPATPTPPGDKVN